MITELIRNYFRRKYFSHHRKLSLAAKQAFSGNTPYEGYRFISRLQKEWHPGVDEGLLNENPYLTAKELSDKIKNKCIFQVYPHLVQQSLLYAEGFETEDHLTLPAEARKYWFDSDRIKSFKSDQKFYRMLFHAFIRGIKRFRALVWNGLFGMSSVDQAYIVLVNITPEVIEAGKNNAGFIDWIFTQSPVADTIRNIRCTVVANPDLNIEWKPDNKSVQTAKEIFPAINHRIELLQFVFRAGRQIIQSVLSVFSGNWKRLVLLEELIEVEYVKQLENDVLAEKYIFTLGEQACRPLWSWFLEQKNIKTPFVYYATSYTLFHYNNQSVDKKIVHPLLKANQWSTCWFQSESAMVNLLQHLDSCKYPEIVGAFDMIDSHDPIPEIPENSIIIFDVEPIKQVIRCTRFGYLVPYLYEDIVVSFWKDISDIARKYNLVLLHKPKRPDLNYKATKYWKLLRELEQKGLYKQISPKFGARHILKHCKCAMALPFTSVGDLLDEHTSCAFAFYDSLEGIDNPHSHANSCQVIAGKDRLEQWITKQFRLAA